jgi:hypothetical protein
LANFPKMVSIKYTSKSYVEVQMSNAPRSMFRWLFPKGGSEGSMGRIPIVATVVGAILPVAAEIMVKRMGETSPNDWMQFLICAAVGLGLLVPRLLFEAEPKSLSLWPPIFVLGIAYLFMATLYGFALLHTSHVWEPPFLNHAGYDTTTDVISSLLFIVAWYLFSKLEGEKGARQAERFFILVMGLALLTSGYWKLVTEAPPARDILNLVNGAIFLGLYTQMLRMLPAPDPFNRLLILLFGCAQIGAKLRDCLGADNQCLFLSSEGATAYIIGWILVAGKISFALYLFYCFFEVDLSTEDRGFSVAGNPTRH